MFEIARDLPHQGVAIALDLGFDTDVATQEVYRAVRREIVLALCRNPGTRQRPFDAVLKVHFVGKRVPVGLQGGDQRNNFNVVHTVRLPHDSLRVKTQRQQITAIKRASG